MAQNKNITLVGMMGCGKSTIANALKNFMPNYQVIELDDEIEKQENCTISEIFENKGEDYFRHIEKELIKKFAISEKKIISTGGGAFIDTENCEILNNNSITVYLSATPDVLYERIKSATNRPLKRSFDEFSNLLRIREPFYKKALHTISVINKKPEEIAQEITRIYNERN